MKRFITLSFIAVVLSSCATLFRKDFNQKVTFNPNEAKDAYLLLDGDLKGKTPVTLELDSKKTYRVKYTKKGYFSNEFELEGKVLPKYIIGDLAMGAVVLGWVPLIIDASTGKWKAFDQMDIDYQSNLVHWTKITEDDLEKYKGQLFEIENLYFEVAKADIKSDSYASLDKVVSFMKKFSSVKFEVRGHTDNQGDDSFNQTLSENRAKSVVEYLKNKGIDSNRLSYKGFGESDPAASNNTKDGRAINRRVEFKLM